MNAGRLNMNPDYTNGLIEMLRQNGLSEADIDVIVNGTYREYSSSEELASSSIFQNDEYSSIIQALSEDYTLEEMPTSLGISQDKIDSFRSALQDNNLTVDNVKAFNRYSSGSNMILSAKRGVPRETISQGIDAELDSRLAEYGFPQEHISQIHDYVNGLDYSKPLHENWQATTEYLEQYGIPRKYTAAINSTVMHKNSLAHLDETLSSLDQGLTTRLPESMKLTRAVKGEYLMSQLQPGEDLTSLIGRRIEETGYSSTSPIYDTSFAKYDDYDVVYDIYAPKGTQGTSITPFSSYGTAEEEVLLNSNDLYITDVVPGVVDKNGRTKTVLKSVMLSKDKTCYKGIGGKEQTFTDIEHATKEELMAMREQAEQQEYRSYRDKLNEAYLAEKDPDTFLHSSFTMRDGETQKCDHYLEQIKGQERTVLSQKSFDYNENFRQNMLEPAIVDFAERNPISSSDTRQNTTSNNASVSTQSAGQNSTNTPTSDFRAISETNNVLSVNNVQPEYANTVASAVQQVEPTVFQQQMNQQMAQQMAQAGPQLTLTMGGGMMGGFVNVLLISLIIGLICGIGIVLALHFIS
ncbi:MAG: ADP-ribosyltransferase [Bacilli bacterium]